MSGEKAYDRIGMQNAWSWDPASGSSGDPIPLHRLLTAATQSKPPQAPQSLPEDTQPIDVSRDRAVLVIAIHDLFVAMHRLRLLRIAKVHCGKHYFWARFLIHFNDDPMPLDIRERKST